MALDGHVAYNKRTCLSMAAHLKAADRLPCAWEEHLLKFRRQADIRKSIKALTARMAYEYGKDCKVDVWIAKFEDWALELVNGGLYHWKVVKLLKLRVSFLCALGRTMPDRNTRWMQSLQLPYYQMWSCQPSAYFFPSRMAIKITQALPYYTL